MIRKFRKRWPLTLLIGLLALYYSQFYPFVHVHHSHEEGSLPFEISVHPIDFDPGQVPGHHGGEDHHHSYVRHYSKWLVVRNLGASLTLQSDAPVIVSIADYPPLNVSTSLTTESGRSVVSDQSTISASGPRSPPRLT